MGLLSAPPIEFGNIAGSSKILFTNEAIQAIWQYSKGLPRLINTICDNALLEGFLMKAAAIDETVVRTVAVDLGLNGEGG